jgi:selenocysteine-specific elongation factor
VAVSAKTGAGLDALRAALARAADRAEHAPGSDATRLWIDRAFTLRGIGTVVTGTLWSGSVGEGDALRVEPRGLDVRVRSVQVHDRPVTRAEAGQRVAVSLPGVERSQVGRGDALVEPGAFAVTYRLDVVLDELAEIPPRVHVHHGTTDVPARVFRVGERWAQLRLAGRVVAARGDRVVLRAETTVGGGTVIDPQPPRHTSDERMRLVERGEAVVHAPVRASELRRLGVEVEGEWAYSQAWLEELRAKLESEIDAADPLDPGVPAPSEPWADAIVPLLGLERRGAKLYRPGVTGELGARSQEAAALEAQLGLEPVKVDDASLARFLEQQGKLVRLGAGHAVSSDAYERARGVLVDGITLAAFRDALGVGRKAAQLYLERFDADGVTRRVGDARVLRKRGR